MAIVAMEFDNARWAWGQDSNQGIDEIRDIQGIHMTTGLNATTAWAITDDPGDSIRRVALLAESSVYIPFDPPLKVNQFKMGADPGGDAEFFVYFV